MTTIFATDALPAVAAIDAPAAPKKHGWLPVLTLLFLASYGLMTMLIVEQGRTIESQRVLIRELFRDSTELSASKKALQDHALPAQAQAADTEKTQTPPSQALSPSTTLRKSPSTQVPTNNAPTSPATSSQAGPQQQRAQNQSAKQKPDFKMPSKPEADLVDDVRTLTTI